MRIHCVLKQISTHNVFGIHHPMERKSFKRQQNIGTLNEKQLVKAARSRAVFARCLIMEKLYSLIKRNRPPVKQDTHFTKLAVKINRFKTV